MTNCSFQCIKPLEQGAMHTSTSGNNFSTMNLTGTISSSAGPFAHNSTQSAAADATYGFGSGYSAFYVGLALALGHSLFDGVSFLLKKLGQNRVARRGHDTARGSFHYLCDGVWWVGMLLMVVAEAMNFVAYMFAPATVVTPLGALSVVFSAAFAVLFLRERLNVFAQLGCALSLLGATLIVCFAPRDSGLLSVGALANKCLDPLWLTYVGLVLAMNAVLVLVANPRWGTRVAFIPISITASFGSITVMCVKAIGLAVMQTANPVAGEAPPFTFWFTYLVICVLIVCLGTQIVFLNKAISCFSIHVVTPVLYVEFTSLSLTASAILYREFNGLESDAVLSIGLGFFVVIVGLFLMCSFRDLKFGWSNWVAYVLELQIPNADPNPDPDAGAVDVDEAVEVVEQPNLQHSPPPVPSSMILKRTESNCSSNTSTLSSSDSDFLSAARNGLSLGRKSGPLSTIAELPSNSSIAGADEQSQPPPKTTAPRKSRKKRLFRFTLGDRFRGVDTGSPLASASSGAGSSSVPQSVRRKPWTLITDLNGYGSRKRALRAAGSQQSAGASGTRTASLELSVRAAAVLSSANSLGTVDSGFCSEAAVAPKGSNPNLNSVDLLRRPRNPFPAHAAPDSADPSSSVPRDHIAIALEELPPRSLLHQVLLSGSAPAEKKTSTTSAADTSVPVPRLPPPAPIVANGVGVGTRRGSASPEGAIASRVAYNSMPAAEEPVC